MNLNNRKLAFLTPQYTNPVSRAITGSLINNDDNGNESSKKSNRVSSVQRKYCPIAKG